MKALFWNKNKKLELVERNIPKLQCDKDVKIKIKYAGICGTDLQILKGNEEVPPDIILGHEAVGEIVEIGSKVKGYKPGDMVIIDPNQYCGECYYCKKGVTNFCENEKGFQIAGINIDGMFAEYFVCNQKYLYKIPHDMSLLKAVLIEPMACVLNNIKAANIKGSDSVLVIGSGPMGALCQMICKNIARLVVATEDSQVRYNKCRTYSDYIYTSSELTINEIVRINQNRKFDVIIDTVGTQMEQALNLAEKNARIIPMGMNKKYSFALKPYELISKGIQLIGASEYNMLFIDTIHTAQRYDLMETIITKIYPIAEYKNAFESILGIDLNGNEERQISELKVVFEF